MACRLTPALAIIEVGELPGWAPTEQLWSRGLVTSRTMKGSRRGIWSPAPGQQPRRQSPKPRCAEAPRGGLAQFFRPRRGGVTSPGWGDLGALPPSLSSPPQTTAGFSSNNRALCSFSLLGSLDSAVRSCVPRAR